MAYSMRVQRSPEFSQLEGRLLLEKNFASLQEFNEVRGLYDNKRRIGFLESLIIPVRTHNLNDFCKDFFFPAVVNIALKARSVADKVILSIIWAICDVYTFPLRLITVIPRYLYNLAHSKEAHPFYRYLIRNGVLPQDLKTDHLYVEFLTGGNGNRAVQGETFNFIELPEEASSIRRLHVVRSI